MYKLLVFLFIVFIIQSCSVSQKDIESQGWKLSDIRPASNRIDSLMTGRDVLDFRDYMNLRGDTIFEGDVPYAVIIDRKAGLSLLESNSIEVVDLITKDTLRYVGKWSN